MIGYKKSREFDHPIRVLYFNVKFDYNISSCCEFWMEIYKFIVVFYVILKF